MTFPLSDDDKVFSNRFIHQTRHPLKDYIVFSLFSNSCVILFIFYSSVHLKRKIAATLSVLMAILVRAKTIYLRINHESNALFENTG